MGCGAAKPLRKFEACGGLLVEEFWEEEIAGGAEVLVFAFQSVDSVDFWPDDLTELEAEVTGRK